MNTTTTEEKATEAIQETIAAQIPAVEESEWADSPELTEAQEQTLAAAAKEATANVEFDDTNHADDQTTTEQPKPVAAAPAVETPVDEIPAGEKVAPASTAKVEQKQDLEPEFDPILLKAAGLATADEAKTQFGSPKALENAVRLLDAKAVTVAQDVIRQQQAHEEAERRVAKEVEQRETAAHETPKFEMPKPPEGEEWDEATVALVQGLQSQFSQQFEEQRQLLAQQQTVIQQVVQEKQQADLRRYVDEFDGFVNELDSKTWAPVLGKGSGFGLKRDSQELKNRAQLDMVASQLAFGRQQQKLEELPRRELLSRALRVAFPEKQEQALRKEVEQEVMQRQKLITNRPTAKVSAPVKSGASAAASRAEAWYAQRGMASLPADEFEYDEI